MRRSSNCGGNSAALAACRGYITFLQFSAADRGDQTFDYDQADDETMHYLGRLPGAGWIPSSRLLAKLDDVRIDAAADKRIIMVCNHPYDNVPQRIFGRAPLAHAVAYSTGKVGLISPEQFARLDLSGFVDLQTLAEATTAVPDGAARGSQPVQSDRNSTSSTTD